MEKKIEALHAVKNNRKSLFSSFLYDLGFGPDGAILAVDGSHFVHFEDSVYIDNIWDTHKYLTYMLLNLICEFNFNAENCCK